MAKYNPQKFIDAVNSREKKDKDYCCPFCGGEKFTTTNNLAAIIIGDDINNINLGPHIPSGMVICEKCGHIDFFALGVLGLLEEDDEK